MEERLPKKVTRRSFLSTSGKLAIGAAGVLLGSSGLFYYGAVQARDRDASRNQTSRQLPGNIVKIGEIEQLTSIPDFEKIEYAGTIQDAWITTAKQGFVYVTNGGNGQLCILSPSCTHLGCLVEPATEAQKAAKKALIFKCPCHGAEFDIAGNAIGVVSQGLDTYQPILANGSVYMDIASPLKRT